MGVYPGTPLAFAVNRFDADSHSYSINGRRVPSVTQILNDERIIDFSMIPGDILEAARARGTYVHQVLHAWLENDYDSADCDPRFRGYVDSGLEYLARLNKKPLVNDNGQAIAVEYRFWNFRLMYGGTIDYVGWDPDGALSIDDWKTGAPSDVAAPLQTAGYEIGIRDCLLPTWPTPYIGPIRRRAVKLFGDGKPGKPYIYTDIRDSAVFLAALSLAHYRQNGNKHG